MLEDNDAIKWMCDSLGLNSLPFEGEKIQAGGINYIYEDGIFRQIAERSVPQAQTRDTFAYKWKKRETYESEVSLAAVREWLVARYGDCGRFFDGPAPAVLLDAGCGAAMSAIELFGEFLDQVAYVGVDVSTAVDVARKRFDERGFGGAFMQADLTRLPFAPASVDLIFSEGVLHHTDSTERALKSLAPLLRPSGWFLFYVYRKKAPLREYADDYIRAQMQTVSADEAWDMLMPLTKLGKALGDLDIDLKVPEDVSLLGIKAGTLPVQRFVYWNLFKAFYRSDMTLEEMNHVNFDWYAPKNAHRQTPEDIRKWCAEAGLDIAEIALEEAGITVIARKDNGA